MGKKFVAPESITELDGEKLNESIESALAALAEVSDDASDEELTEAEAILAYVNTAKGEVQNREAAEQARIDRLEAIRAASKPEEKAEEPEAPAAEVVEPAVEEAPPAPAEEKVEEKELVSASAKTETASVQKLSTAEKIASQQKETPVKKEFPRASLVAAAGNTEFASGHQFANLAEAGPALFNRLDNLPHRAAPKGVSMRNGALQFRLPASEFTQTALDESEMLQRASREARLEGGSLVAAGGWGAPSERSLDFCVQEELDGLIQLPEIQITRGGISYTKGPTGFWDMTEATAEAGVEQKTSLRPSIPTFVEQRLDAVGVMVEAGLLLRQGWPELVERYAALALKAHQYKLNQKKIAQIQAFTGAATNIATGFGNELDLLHVMELVAEGERQRNFLGSGQTLEVIAPAWARAVMRAGLAQRSGVDTISVTNAQLDSHFTARGVRVQWLRGYQDMALASGIAVTYPDSIEFIMYPAGTYVVGVAPVITLDTIYDSVNLKKNDYVHLFVEQGVLMTNPCGEGRRITLPFFANGRRAGVTDAVGTAGQNDNLFNTATANT
jgi:hypothetical protein